MLILPAVLDLTMAARLKSDLLTALAAGEGLEIDAGQVQRVTGYADTQPLDGKDPKDPMNRRISIVVLSSATEKIEADRQKAQPPKKK